MRAGAACGVVALLAALAGCGGTVVPSGGSAAIEPLQIHADPDWIRDAQGRVVLLRGANYSGLEFGNFIGAVHGPRAANFAQMASWGFNVIRLPIAWSYLEPAPNTFDPHYLDDEVDPVVTAAARAGILVVLDMHQFEWSPCLGGNGAPAWVCDGHHYSNDQNGQLQAQCDFFTGAVAADGRTLMDHFIDVWRLVAAHYAGDPRVAGFDFFNEPTAYTCLGVGKFERLYLNPFYRRLRAAVAAAGAQQTFFFCPSVTRNVGLPTVIQAMGPNVVYAPHLYTETGGLPTEQYDGDAGRITADYAQAVREAGQLGGPLFVGEFGGNTDSAGGYLAATAAFLRDSLAEQDRRLLGGAVWAYFPSDNTFSVVDADGTEKDGLVDILARPYARRTAGIPSAMAFDPDSKVFTFSFQDDMQRRPPDPTEIFLPARRHYARGFTVTVNAGDYWTFDAAGERLFLYRGGTGAHSVRVAPAAP